MPGICTTRNKNVDDQKLPKCMSRATGRTGTKRTGRNNGLVDDATICGQIQDRVSE